MTRSQLSNFATSAEEATGETGPTLQGGLDELISLKEINKDC